VPNNLESDELQRARTWQHLLWIWDEQCDSSKRLGLKPELFCPVSVPDDAPAWRVMRTYSSDENTGLKSKY